MPPKELCYCSHCGPTGVLFSLPELRMHELRLKREAEEPPAIPTTPTVDHLVHELTAITLADQPSPAAENARHPLWTSRRRFQQTLVPPRPIDISTNDIQLSMNRMLNSGTASTPDQSMMDAHAPLHPTAPDLDPRKKRVLQVLSNIRKKTADALNLPKEDILQAEGEYGELDAALKLIQKKEYMAGSFDETSQLLDRLRKSIHETKEWLPRASRGPVLFDSTHHFHLPVNNQDVVVQCAIFLGVVASVMMGVSRKAGDFIMATISFILRVAFVRLAIEPSPVTNTIIQGIPITLPAALSKFDVDHKITIYGVCPTCHHLYKPSYPSGSNTPSYPAVCNAPQIAKSARDLDRPVTCGTDLLIDGDTQRPLKTFHYYHFHDFLASLLSRPEIEEAMDNASDAFRDSLEVEGVSRPHIVQNPFDASFLRGFDGPDGKTFACRRGSEGRYIFSLHVDFFNPNGNRLRGPKISSGIISMACLNLPIDIRYKPENMYLAGIIPGPIEPHGDELNNYLEPVIDDLATSWHSGVRYSRTARYPDGRCTRCAVAACVCDLPAARKTAQIANFNSHHYCSVCQCHELPTRKRTDVAAWRPHDNKDRRLHAENYRNAKTGQERQKLFEKHGVRWSPLWNLPYWDPGRQLVVDAMHCVLEGLVKDHIREILSLSWDSASQKDVVGPAFQWNFSPAKDPAGEWSPKDTSDVSKIHRKLTLSLVDFSSSSLKSLRTGLMDCNSKPLQHVYEDLSLPGNLPAKPQKKDYVEKMIEWRVTKPLKGIESKIKYATPTLMRFIQRVIQDTTTPSFVQNASPRFGEAGAGTVKAAAWRSLATVYIPIALVLSWGATAVHPTQEVAQHLKQILDHSMALFSATRIACLRTTSETRVTAYRNNMVQYVRDLHVLHPSFGAMTNQHMALHISDFLQWFGPVHSWWTFPFERLIGILQRLPTNNRTGEAEASMLNAHLRAANLRRWVSRRDCPLAIQELKTLFNRSYGHDQDNDSSIMVDSDSPPQNYKVSPELKNVVPANSKHYARFKYLGTVYSQSTAHLGNSLVEYHPAGKVSGIPVPGVIRYIYSIQDQVFFVIQRHNPPPPNTVDPFCLYTHFPAKLYGTSLSSDMDTVRPEWIYCHFARFIINDRLCVVLSLSQW